MFNLSLLFYISMTVTLLLMLLLGLFSAKRVHSASDFCFNGGRAGILSVVGTVISSAVGGSSTIGTAALAQTAGLSCLWFTFGMGMGCLVLGLAFVKTHRKSQCTTIMGIIQQAFGTKAARILSILLLIGTFFTLQAQVLAGISLLYSIFPSCTAMAPLLICLLMLLFVVFGGVKSVGLLGALKTILLLLTVAYCTMLVLHSGSGFGVYANILDPAKYANLFSRGFGIDLGKFISASMGIVVGQSYMQAILSAKSDRTARCGMLLSAIVLPIVGFGSALVGYDMLVHHPEVPSTLAFCSFVIQRMHPIIAGIVLATLLLTVICSGAGISLGFASIFTNDLYLAFDKNATPKRQLLVNRFSILAIFIACFLTSYEMQDIPLQDLSCLSMALRGVAIFLPLVCAMFCPQRFTSRAVLCGSIVGVILDILFQFVIALSFDPFFLSIGASYVLGVAISYWDTHVHSREKIPL